MNNYYISFGYVHSHVIDGITLDKDSLICIRAATSDEARLAAFNLFGATWAFMYPEDKLDEILHFFPRGVVLTVDAES